MHRNRKPAKPFLLFSGCLLLFKADATVPKNREGIVNAIVI